MVVDGFITYYYIHFLSAIFFNCKKTSGIRMEDQSNLISPFESSARVLFGTLMKTPALRVLAERLDGASLQTEKKENSFRINWIETMVRS